MLLLMPSNLQMITATLLFYDQPEYDVFWKMVTDLDVPVYFHPRGNIAQLANLEYGHAPFLLGAGQEFTATVSTHILGYVCLPSIIVQYTHLSDLSDNFADYAQTVYLSENHSIHSSSLYLSMFATADSRN